MSSMLSNVMGFLLHPRVKKELNEALASGMESIFAENAVREINKRIPKHEIEQALIAGTISLAALSEDNPFELSALRKTTATMGLRVAARNVYDLVNRALSQDFGLEFKFENKDGEYFTVTDPNIIMQNVVAYHAEKAAKRSRFYDEVEFNEQKGGTGVCVNLDFTNGTVKPLEGMSSVNVGNLTINIDICRDKIFTDQLVMNGRETDITNATSKSIRTVRWPASRYGEYVRGKLVPQEILTKGEPIADVAFLGDPIDVAALPECKPEMTVGLKEYLMGYYGAKPGEVLVLTRKMLQERITEMTNNPASKLHISPTLMQHRHEDADGVVRITLPEFGSVYDANSSKLRVLEGMDAVNDDWKTTIVKFNEQHATGVERIIDVDATAPKETPVAPATETPPSEKKDVTLPITREMCGKGNKYTCRVCDKSGLKKNNLVQYKPAKLPEGMTNDYPGVGDSVTFENSWMCGTCQDGFRKQREAAVKAFSTGKAELAKATAEQDKIIQEGIEAETVLNNAKDQLADHRLAMEAIKDKGIEVPSVMTKHEETLVFNMQQAEIKFHAIDARLGGANNKATAISNGTAIPLPAAKDTSAKPTPEKATVLFKPGTGKNGKSNRAERRAQEAQRKARNVR